VLRFFRINDPYRLLGLLLILVLLGLPFLLQPGELLWSELKSFVLGEAVTSGKILYTQLYDDTAPLTIEMFGALDLLFGRSVWARHGLALMILFFQAAYFAILLINNKAYAENTYLPALVCGSLCFFSFDLMSISSELFASTLLLFALNQLFHEIEFKIQRDETVLKLGFYLGLSTLFIFSYWIFLPLNLLILIIFTRPGGRKIFLLLLGFFLPHALLIALYAYWDNLSLLWANFYASQMTLQGNLLVPAKGLLVLASVPLFYWVVSVFMINREVRFTRYQSQLMQIMFLWFGFSLLHLLVTREVSPVSLLPIIPPTAYFISHYLLLIRRRWIAELMLWIFLGGITSINQLSRNNLIPSVDFTALFAKPERYGVEISGKRVMKLGEGYGIYTGNQLGGHFYNWNLSRVLFETPDVYGHLEAIATSFEEDPPELILDENNLMEGVMDRVPSLRHKYRKEGSRYIWIEH